MLGLCREFLGRNLVNSVTCRVIIFRVTKDNFFVLMLYHFREEMGRNLPYAQKYFSRKKLIFDSLDIYFYFLVLSISLAIFKKTTQELCKLFEITPYLFILSLSGRNKLTFYTFFVILDFLKLIL